MGTTRILAEPGGEVLADLPLLAVSHAEFPGSGRALLTLRHRYGRELRVDVDVAHRRYAVLELAGRPQPLVSAAAHLTAIAAPPPVPSAPANPTMSSLAVNLMMAVGGSLFVVGSVLVALTATSLKDGWIAVFGIVFFGACAASGIPDLQRRRPGLAALLPLVAAAAEIPWTIGGILLMLFVVGDAPATFGRAQERALTAAAAVPATFGLLWAVVAAARGAAPSAASRLSLVVGAVLCLDIFAWLTGLLAKFVE